MVDPIEVLQVDRDAAIQLMRAMNLPACVSAIESGLYDNDIEVQAFARHRIASTPPASSLWQTIETAPKDGTFVDLWVNNPAVAEGGQRVTNAAWFDGAWREYAEWDEEGGDGDLRWFDAIGYTTPVETEFCKATHWQPLPVPPSTKDTPDEHR